MRKEQGSSELFSKDSKLKDMRDCREVNFCLVQVLNILR